MEKTIEISEKKAKEQVTEIQLRIVENAILMLLSVIALIMSIPAEDLISFLTIIFGFLCFIKTLREIINSFTKLVLVLIEHGKLS